MNRRGRVLCAVPMLRNLPVIVLLGVGLVLTLASPHRAQASQSCTTLSKPYATFHMCYGSLADGSVYEFRVPTAPVPWNHKLVSMSGDYTTLSLLEYYVTGQPVAQWLLHNGYAVAGSGCNDNAWDVEGHMRNELQTLDLFAAQNGAPTVTVAYGASFMGMVSAALVQQHPDRFGGAVTVAGVLGGSVGSLNQGLDCAFVVQQLLGAGSGLEIVHITNPGDATTGNWGLGVQLLNAAQGTPEGRARIALACAFEDMPGWYDPLSAEPAADDYAAQEQNQVLWATGEAAAYFFGALRAGVEAAAGGNPSWNTGVDYAKQLEKSINYAEVLGLYQAAGISLEADLAQLSAAPRVAADPGAIAYMHRNGVFNGDLGGRPVLALHTTGDGLVVNQAGFAYRSAAIRAQDSDLLREAYVHRAGHCTLSYAETIVGILALFQRVGDGAWGDLTPATLNAAAAALGPTYNVLPPSTPVTPAYSDYDPAPFLRPYDLAGPRLVSIEDVPADLGGKVRLEFRANGADVTGSQTLTQYDVYREFDPVSGPTAARTGSARTNRAVAPARTQLAGWDHVGAVPPSADTVYSIMVPTLADSDGTGLHLATFMVRAATTDPATSFDSPPDSGYSVDNLGQATPVQLSLVSAEVLPGRVRPTWRAAGGTTTATVYRRTAGEDWGSLGTVTSDGTGRLVFEDIGVVPGTRYGYRLGVVESGHVLLTAETWIDVPPAARFALSGSIANPAVGALTIRFELADASPARLELLDLAGRRVTSREVGSLGAGEHTLTLGSTLAPGVYLVRLTHAGRPLVARAVVLR